MGKRGPDPAASDEDILRVIRNHYAPAIGTQDVADELDVARQTADRRLRAMEQENLVGTDKVGQSRIWWIETKGRRQLQD